MEIVEIRKELEKYTNLREKVLRLNEIGKFNLIVYGAEYIWYYDININTDRRVLIDEGGGCHFCRGVYCCGYKVQLKSKNCNNVKYYTCYACKDKTLCAYCLREKENCTELTKKKISFWLYGKIFPKDIRILITNLFFFEKIKKRKYK